MQPSDTPSAVPLQPPVPQQPPLTPEPSQLTRPTQRHFLAVFFISLMWGILGVEPNARRVEIDAAYRRRRSETHPDRGGDADSFDAVQRAYEQATRSQYP